jgi:hypothetical protein
MNVELRNEYGSTIDRKVDVANDFAYGLRSTDEVSWPGGPCYTVLRKHWSVNSMEGVDPSLTLYVQEREDYR